MSPLTPVERIASPATQNSRFHRLGTPSRSRRKGENKHDAFRTVGVRVRCAAVLQLLVHQGAPTSGPNAVVAGGANVRLGTKTGAPTHVSSRTNVRGSHFSRCVLEWNKERIGRHKIARRTLSARVGNHVGVHALFLGAVSGGNAGKLNNGRVRSHDCFQRRHQSLIVQNFRQGLCHGRVLIDLNAKTKSIFIFQHVNGVELFSILFDDKVANLLRRFVRQQIGIHCDSVFEHFVLGLLRRVVRLE
mmetsp:Transcript_18725/g.44153  ORF Transcript_18725/g.44153 Transcript_18725/m.44153 type:complete len:246 (+) Transcript_18725:321-1058(+)